LPDGVFQTTITSPPYWSLRDYGIPGQIGLEASVKEYIASLVKVFDEVRRVTRDDGARADGWGCGWRGSLMRQGRFNDRLRPSNDLFRLLGELQD
jgi:hypothetical protein